MNGPDSFKHTQATAYRFVVCIGWVSLFSDMTYQGAHGNAGPYLGLLGASGTIVGLVAGGGEMVNYVLRLFTGYLTDRSRHYWRIAFVGYSINLLSVPMLALAGHWPAAAALLILERAGKGIRTPVRDVMLSHAADKVGRGRAFGLHEALDQTGGVLGPLLVAGLLFFHKGYRVSFAFLAIPACLGLIVLAMTRRAYPHPEQSAEKLPVTGPRRLPKRFWIFLAGLGLLAVGYADFALMAFHLHQHAILTTPWIPVVFAVAMGLQGLASLGSGRLFDKIGIRTLILASLPAVLFAPLVFLGGPSWVWAGVAFWALGMGAQSSVMKAFVAESVESGSRGSAYGVLNSAYGVSWFAGSAVLGFLYDHSLTGLVVFSVVAQALALPVLWIAQKAGEKQQGSPPSQKIK